MTDLPQSTHRGTLTIMGIELIVHKLDDGSSVIEADGMEKLFEAMFSGCELSEEDAMKLAKVVHSS